MELHVKYHGIAEVDGPWTGLPLVGVEVKLIGTTVDGRKVELSFPEAEVPTYESAKFQMHLRSENPNITQTEDKGVYSKHHVDMQDAKVYFSLHLDKLKINRMWPNQSLYVTKDLDT